MAALIDHLISIGILVVILYLLDKYKSWRINNWKRALLFSTVYWILIGLPNLYLSLNNPPLPFLLLVLLIGIPISAAVIRAIASWIVYPFIDALKKK